jgi:tetraacyldisaccharide 4'-kinase
MKPLRLLLLPFSLFYGLAVIIRNWFYDGGLISSQEFSLPIISVGNLDVGGAGKSPMTEYLIRLFKDKYKIATLSRGYGRETEGYLTARISYADALATREPTAAATADLVGDEPAQFKHKFPDITVAVCEKRAEGIIELKKNHELILLDDAFQHRAVKPGMSILLFDYNQINKPDILLPAGNMREPFSSRWRADVLVVNKCPEQLTDDEKKHIARKIKPLPYQSLFFSSIAYQPMQDLDGNKQEVVIDENTTVILLTGIANSKPLVEHLKRHTKQVVHHNYPDHHRFTLKNITKLAAEYSASSSQKKLIVTTEKDAQRLVEQKLQSLVKRMPFLVLPIGVQFLDHSGQQFDQLVTAYVREHPANNLIH